MFIVWLPFVNHILNYNLLTYLLTYLPMVTIVNRKGVSSGGGKGDRYEGGRPPRAALYRGRHLRGENFDFWHLHYTVLA